MLRVAFLLLLASTYAPGPQVLTFLSDVDDSDQPYAVYIPNQFDPKKPYPLVISLHGAYSNHRVNLRRVFGRGNLPGETDAEASRYFPKLREVQYIVASPFARGTLGYQGIPEKDVYDVLADVKRRFLIDEDRIYLTGLSMGGGGALWLGLTRPDLWAAIAPVCPAVPAGTETLAPNALHVPVHLFHGERDPVVPVSVSRQWHKDLSELGAGVEYVEFPGVRHNSWDGAYRNAAIFDWFSRFRRVRHPERVRFVSSQYKYNRAYWVEFDGLTPGTPASIDAKFTAKNRLDVKTENLDGFTLHLDGHPQFQSGQPVDVAIDGKIVRARKLLSLVKTGKGWESGKYAPTGKRAGAEGPMGEVIAGRHVYVYGTADSPGPEEVSRRRALASQAAEWRGATRLSLALDVKADKDVGPRDIAGVNLVLFGTAETNSLIARHAPKLPMALNPGAADYGLAYVYPINGRYVLVNSGLPFWHGIERVRSEDITAKFMPRNVHLLLSAGDYVLFRGSVEHVVAAGRFDRDWKLTPEHAGKLRSSGAIRLN